MRDLPAGGLYGILDTRWLNSDELPNAAKAFLAGGCRILQLRMKDALDDERLRAQRAVCQVLEELGEDVWLAINDRADLALILDREAPANVKPILHLGQNDIPPSAARKLVGDSMVIGLSTHNASQVTSGCLEAVDYLGYGPVYPTLTKANPDPTTGQDGLAQALEGADKPMVAIGGVTCDKAETLRAMGARWVVVIRDLLEGVDVMSLEGSNALSQKVQRLQERLT